MSDLRERLEEIMWIFADGRMEKQAATLREVLDKPHLLMGEPVAKRIDPSGGPHVGPCESCTDPAQCANNRWCNYSKEVKS